jgi:hypothetical protein
MVKLGIFYFSILLHINYLILKENLTHYIFVWNWSKIQHGVPQGSVLGRLLYFLYINDLPLAIDGSAMPIIFADDSS